MRTSIQSREVWLTTIRMRATPRSPSRKCSRPPIRALGTAEGASGFGPARGTRLLIADPLLVIVVAHDHPAAPVRHRADLVALVDVPLPRDLAVSPVEIHAVAHSEGGLPVVAALVHDFVFQNIDAIDPGEVAAPPLRDLLVAAAVGGAILQPAGLDHAAVELAQVQARVLLHPGLIQEIDWLAHALDVGADPLRGVAAREKAQVVQGLDGNVGQAREGRRAFGGGVEQELAAVMTGEAAERGRVLGVGAQRLYVGSQL